MKILLALALISFFVILTLIGMKVRRNVDEMKMNNDLDFIEAYLKEHSPNVQRYLFLRGEFDYLRRYNIRSDRLDRAWSSFLNKYYEYFVDEKIHAKAV